MSADSALATETVVPLDVACSAVCLELFMKLRQECTQMGTAVLGLRFEDNSGYFET